MRDNEPGLAGCVAVLAVALAAIALATMVLVLPIRLIWDYALVDLVGAEPLSWGRAWAIALGCSVILMMTRARVVAA